MMDDMLRNIEYLREKADVSYEEASDLLTRYDGNVMRVLVELEHQGRVYAQPAPEQTGRAQSQQQQQQQECSAAKEKATSFINKALATKLVVEKKNEDGEKDTVLNVNVPLAAGIAIAAPWLTLAAAGLAFVTGHNVKIEREKPNQDNAG